MSSAKAALESDTRVSMPLFYFQILVMVKVTCNSCSIAVMHYHVVFMQVLAFEAGRKGKIRVNTISAGT